MVTYEDRAVFEEMEQEAKNEAEREARMELKALLLDVLDDSDPIDVNQFIADFKWDANFVYSCLSELVEDGKVARVGGKIRLATPADRMVRVRY